MSIYTTVVMPDGEAIQFHAGDDNMEVFKVGDEVPWRILPDSPGEGHLLDDVYHGISHRLDVGFKMWWIIIKDHKICDVVPTAYDEFDDCAYYEKGYLVNKYGIKYLDANAWPDSSWAKSTKGEYRRIKNQIVDDGHRWAEFLEKQKVGQTE